MVEQLLQLLVGVVDTQLLKGVELWWEERKEEREGGKRKVRRKTRVHVEGETVAIEEDSKGMVS